MSSEDKLSRRGYLAVAGTGLSVLAGCIGSGADSGASARATTSSTDTTTPTATTTHTGGTTTGTNTGTATTTPGGSPTVEEMEAQLSAVDFEGEYFDSHAHWVQGTPMPSRYATQMRAYDIGAAVLFSPSVDADREYESFLRTVTDPGIEYLPFMGAPPPGRKLPVELRSLYDGTEPTFWGIGEFKPQSTVPDFDGDRLSRLWSLAADLDIPVMYHPFAEQEGTVEPGLSDHPETTFLLHGHQMMSYGQESAGLGPTLPRLLREYDNLYWTADVTTLLDGTLVRFTSASEFVDWYDDSADQFIETAKSTVSTLLDAGPEQVMWGTDVNKTWNTKDEAFSRVMDATERILEGVPEKHHAAYKSENALAMFDLPGSYDRDGDGEISLGELADAAADFANGELSMTELQRVVAAYTGS